MKKQYTVSIVMPCLNEAETLPACIRKAQSFLHKNRIAGKIIVADNGSTDGSQAIARELGARVVHVNERGYGSALQGGFEAAQSQYIIMGDADDSYDFSDLAKFLDALEDGYDLVIGNRFQGGIMPGAMPFLHRYVGNPILSWIARLFFKSNVGDFHCGLRGFRKDVLPILNLQTIGMEFASEMIVKATMKNMRVKEVPIILYPDGRTRSPHLRTWADGWRHLRFLLLYSPRWLFFYPGILLAILGVLLSFFLISRPQTFAGITLDINTLMYAAFLIIMGVQSVLFSLFTYVFGVNADLLPRDESTEKLLRYMGLERGIVISSAMIVLGFASSIGALVYWSQNFFGEIDPRLSMRLVIPGAVLFTLGIQTLFASFFLSILNTQHK